MRKRVVARGNVRRGDFMRAVVTDTLPEEVPIIFSNDGFYLRRIGQEITAPNCQDFLEALFRPPKGYTKPYRYNVLRDSYSARGLSLIHPSAQEGVALFYQKYDTLICHYCAKSQVSLRSPYKVGSTFFVRGSESERNRFRAANIDTLSIESTVSNPSSYFAYNKISRAHEFFDSNDYHHLEKKFLLFRSLDVSKCFNSIYTHTLYWATDGIEIAKNNASSIGFANEFDSLMQAMNYNETNGICIGPEVSRVFAEILLSEVDKLAIERLARKGIRRKIDYDIRRYVDDYYVFANSGETADRVSGAIIVALKKFNLHLNDNKTVTMYRPFATKKSQIISDANDALTAFFDKIIETKPTADGAISIPRRVFRSDALMRFLLKKVKAICALHGASYETVSDYIISAVSRRISSLCNDYETAIAISQVSAECYVSTFMLLTEVIYFFYTVNPTVRASLYVSRAIIVSTRLFREKYPDRLPYLAENIVRWTLDLAQSIANGDRHQNLTAVPLEVLNAIIPLKEITDEEPLVDALIKGMCGNVEAFGYFEIVSFLFLIGGKVEHGDLRKRLFARAKQIVETGIGPRIDSESAHICLDLLACPFLPLDKRASWFNNLRSLCGLPKISNSDAKSAVLEMTERHWFVRWDRVDLLALLRKKELSTIY